MQWDSEEVQSTPFERRVRRGAPASTSDAMELRALLVEDSTDDAELVLRMLHKAGYGVESLRVDTPAALREALDRGFWDVIISDYRLPSLTACDALAIIGEFHCDVPVIIVSGSVGEVAAIEVMKAGAHDFFLKGNLTRLGAAIERERTEARVRQERREVIRELRESRERLRHAVRARDEFLSIASHELKTPLTTLTLQAGSAQTLLASLPEDLAPAIRLKSTIDGFALQIARMTTMINNLLEVNRITSDRMTLAPESFDLRDAVDTGVVTLKDYIRRSGSIITISDVVPVVGRWDRHGIESVVVNLLSNAFKFGEGQSVEVEVDLVGDQARLVVTDHGVGIAMSDQERIFHRFERAVPERHFGGLGLGLWVSRQIVEAHGGSISVASKPNCGSIFTVLLPCEPKERR